MCNRISEHALCVCGDGPAKELTMSSPVLEHVVLIRVQAVNDAGEGPWSGINLCLQLVIRMIFLAL
jgi:hypothetical protein